VRQYANKAIKIDSKNSIGFSKFLLEKNTEKFEQLI
jgi:hypothetical protein